ncbi:MAG: hypothetical protein HQL64_09730 [Magnetococcales bacterium]|nr:hypothetical protein [Magnetococcales bacterium]
MNTPQKVGDTTTAEILTESRQTMVMLTRHDLQLWVQNLDRLARSHRNKPLNGRLHPCAR